MIRSFCYDHHSTASFFVWAAAYKITHDDDMTVFAFIIARRHQQIMDDASGGWHARRGEGRSKKQPGRRWQLPPRVPREQQQTRIR